MLSNFMRGFLNVWRAVLLGEQYQPTETETEVVGSMLGVMSVVLSFILLALFGACLVSY
jgi:hypothetical protein